MGYSRKSAVSAANVRIVEKNNRDYPALFADILSLRLAVRVYSNDYLILTSFGKNADRELPFGGIIGKFTDIPPDAEWFDTELLDLAREDDKREINIPKKLKPNYEGFYCGLFPKEHLFTFESFSESNNLSENHVLKWIEEVLSNEKIKKKYGRVEVDIVPDYDLVERIIAAEQLRDIELVIRMPNPDDLTEEQFQAVEAKMLAINAKEQRIEYKAAVGEYLEIDPITAALARVASENGYVDAKLREDGLIKSVSTKRHPAREQDVFDPDDISWINQFNELSRRLRDKVIRNRGVRGV